MSSIPNEFNPRGYYTMNQSDFVPIQMNPNLKNHQSEMVPSMFVTSDNKNHTKLLSPAYTCYHDSQISSSSLRNNNSRVAYQMRSNMVSPFSMPCMAQTSGFVKLSQVCITQTITNRYHAIVPTNNMVTLQNDNERVNRVMTSNPTLWNSTSHPPNVFDKHYETFTPKPIDYFCLQHEDSANRQHFDLFSSSARHQHELYVAKDGPPVKRIRKPTEFYKGNGDYIDYGDDKRSEDDENDGLIHNLPYEKDGPFICLECNSLFDTSHILAAHTQLVHCRSETNKERKKRLKVNHQEVPGKSHKINKAQTGGQSCRRKLRQ